MRSGLYLNCWMILLGGGAYFVGIQPVGQAAQLSAIHSSDQSQRDEQIYQDETVGNRLSPIVIDEVPVTRAKKPNRSQSRPIRLVDYPQSRRPKPGSGYNNPWQSESDRQSGSDPSIQLVPDESVEPNVPFRNSGPQIRRVSRPLIGHSAPPGGVMPEGIESAGSEWSDQSLNAVPRPRASGTSGVRNGSVDPGLPMRGNSRALSNKGTPGEPPIIGSNRMIHERATPQSPPEFQTAVYPDRVGRGIVTPPDWDPTMDAVPAVRFGSVVQRSNGVTQIPSRPPTNVSDPAVRGYSQPIQNAGYSEYPTQKLTNEIPLRPGQILPGFRDQLTRTARFTELESPQELRLAPTPNRNRELLGQLPAGQLPAGQSPVDALQFLTRATEREIAALSPGQTASDLQFYIERHVHLRLLYLMAGQTERALRPIPSIPAADQEFWTQVLWGVHCYFDIHQVPDPTERAAQTVAQFNTAILRLKERAPLELKNVIFSHKIGGFGEYETYPQDEFAPGQRVLVYAEIANYHSELTTDGVYRTQLKSTLQFFSADDPDQPLESKAYPVTVDVCRNHRRDYFHSYVVDIPARCSQGRHLLRLIIEDELSGKTAEYPVEFAVR